MTKINWKQKLSSRKFWVAIVGFITALCVAFGVDEMTAQQVAGVVTAGGVLIAYILGESYIDGNRVMPGIPVEDIEQEEVD